MVIVTQNQYILASKIYHVVLNEEWDWQTVRVNGRATQQKFFRYIINVVYAPESTTTNTSSYKGDDRAECSVTIRSAYHAYKVYKDLINQIREQLPDQLYLDKALENILNQEDLEKIRIQEGFDSLESKEMHDAMSKEVRRARKAKRNGKKVLRGPKKRP
jgi:hypothetical protein